MRKAIAQFIDQLVGSGCQVEDPRPRFSPAVEQALEDELQEEMAHGEAAPSAVPELPASVQLVSHQNSRILLYVLQSALDDGFWGVRADVVAELKGQPLPWGVVLLRSAAQTGAGHWFESGEVLRHAGTEWQLIVPDGARYEVREPFAADGGQAFASINDFLNLLQQRDT